MDLTEVLSACPVRVFRRCGSWGVVGSPLPRDCVLMWTLGGAETLRVAVSTPDCPVGPDLP